MSFFFISLILCPFKTLTIMSVHTYFFFIIYKLPGLTGKDSGLVFHCFLHSFRCGMFEYRKVFMCSMFWANRPDKVRLSTSRAKVDVFQHHLGHEYVAIDSNGWGEFYTLCSDFSLGNPLPSDAMS